MLRRSVLATPRWWQLATRARCAAGATSRSFAASSADDGGGAAASDAAPVHVPVLLHETIALWGDANASTADKQRYFVDGTTGFGGHSRALLERCKDARLLCIDRDPEVRSSLFARYLGWGSCPFIPSLRVCAHHVH